MWKDDFVELLFSNDQTKINAIKSAKLKYENFPSYLYRYRPCDDYSIDSLKDDKIFLSDPRKFNDPYDCAFMLTNFNVDNKFINQILLDDPNGFRKAYDLNKKQLVKLKKSPDVIKDLTRIIAKKNHPEHKNDPKKLRDISKDYEKQFREMKLDINELKGHMGVVCFSEQYNSLLMWSHYAKEHTGFCVQYDFKSLGYNSHLTRLLFPIIYTNNIFPIDDYVNKGIYSLKSSFKNVFSSFMSGVDLTEMNINGNELNKEKMKFNNMFYVYAALNKYKGWEYENEWRYVISNKKDLKSEFIDVPKPVSIYLGAKADGNKDAILEIGKDRNIDVYQMQMKSSEYTLETKKIL